MQEQCGLWGGAEGTGESHCGNRELRDFGNADDINNGNRRAPSPLLRGPRFHDHSKKGVAVPPKGFCSVRKRSTARFLRPSHIRIAL
jgi:hypothetical protein